MKKLILILLMAISIAGYSQEYNKDYKDRVVLPTYTMDGDTNFTFRLSNQSNFISQIEWTGLDKTDGSVKVQYSLKNMHTFTTPPDSTFVDYPIDSLLLNSAIGTSMLQDMGDGTGATWLRIAVSNGTTSSGSLILDLHILTKR